MGLHGGPTCTVTTGNQLPMVLVHRASMQLQRGHEGRLACWRLFASTQLLSCVQSCSLCLMMLTAAVLTSCWVSCVVMPAGTAQLPPQQAYVTPLQLPPRQQQFRPAGSSGSSMPRILAAAGTVGGVLGVQVRSWWR